MKEVSVNTRQGRLLLALCPTLMATTTLISGGLIGGTVMVSLFLSAGFALLFRRFLSQQWLFVPLLIVIGACVSGADLVLEYFPRYRDEVAGIVVSLIVVDSLILVSPRLFDAQTPWKQVWVESVGNGLIFLALVVLVGGVREIVGMGTVLGRQWPFKLEGPFLFILLPVGAFWLLAVIAIIANLLKRDVSNDDRNH